MRVFSSYCCDHQQFPTSSIKQHILVISQINAKIVCCIIFNLWGTRHQESLSLVTTQGQLTDSTPGESASFYSISKEWPKSGQAPGDLWGLRDHPGSQRGKNKASPLCYVCLSSLVLTRDCKMLDAWSVCLYISILLVDFTNKINCIYCEHPF